MKILFPVHTFIMLATAFNVAAFEKNIRFTNISNQNGLPNNTVNAICEDSRGFIWFGTDNGLCKYDGNTFIMYDTSDDGYPLLPSKIVSDIFQDDNGFLWIVTPRGIRRYNMDNDRFERLANDSIMVENGHAVCLTSNGDIYIGTGNKLNIYNQTRNRIDPVQIYESDIRGRFTAMAETCDGSLWCGTKTDGLLRYMPEMYTIDRYRENDGLKRWLPSDRISALFSDPEGNLLWIGTEDKGVCCYDISKSSFFMPDGLSGIHVSCFNQDADGYLWIGSDNGLYIYDKKNFKVITHIVKSFSERTGLCDNFITEIVRDKEDNMLVGTTYGGVDVFSRTFRHFIFIDWGEDDKSLSGRTVRQIISEDDRFLLIATEDGNLNILDRKTMKIKKISLLKGRTLNPYSLLSDSNGNLWIGAKFNGLFCYNPDKGTYKQFTAETCPGLSVDSILSLAEDDQGQIWIGTSSGLAIYDKTRDLFIPFDPSKFRKQSIDCLKKDKSGNIWISTRNMGLFIYDVAGKSVKPFSRYVSDYNGTNAVCSDNWINCTYQDSRDWVWISTNNGGLNCFKPETKDFTNYTVKDFLPSNTVYSITEDFTGNIWFSSDNGLGCFNADTGHFTNYSESEGLPNRQFNNNSVYRDSEGRLYFGTINGLLSFHPDSLSVSTSSPEVVFTELLVLGKHVKPGPEAPIRHSIENEKTIVLTHTEAQSFSLKYTVPTISHASSIFFSTKFGNEKDWSFRGTGSQTLFANLSPGEYILQVRASFNNRWNGQEPVNSIKIIVKPPLWLSPAALVIYVLIAAGIAILIYVFVKRRNRIKAEILREKLEKNKAEDLNKLRMNFFTNISHQIRIPLSLVIAPLESMMAKEEFSENITRKLTLISANASKMKMLLDELLLFSKIKSSAERIKVSRGNVFDFISEIASGFRLVAEEKAIEFTVKMPENTHNVWFSAKSLEKILYNLLSNAFKFTEKGEVFLTSSLSSENGIEMLKIEVGDTGPGIRQEELNKIFDGYYQVEDNSCRNIKGFGIGLSLTKELAILHKGSINVHSIVGKGTCFTVLICVDGESFTPEEKLDRPAYEQEAVDYSFLLQKNIYFDEDQNNDAGKYRILVVEDDKDLLNYYKDFFRDHYIVSVAENGVDALKKIQTSVPDIVISDVMMPGMDGYELTRRLKDDVTTSHIPVILLTAKTGLSSQLNGLDSGADLYIEKPFHPSFLSSSIRNIIRNKERLLKKYAAGSAEIEEMATSLRDRKLLEKITASVMANLSNEHYSINDLTRDAGISRTLLHLKLKALVGMSTTEYINSVRIKQSVNLLMSGYRVSEAAYATGFASPGYYSRCFHKVYGMSPVDYVASHKIKHSANKNTDRND